ncbi:hypothetical protein [Polaromonas jejuensis]|uniref:hypothetical protein n=1 Tax=Polaromonas jejuensis TaxID=457502 RepID=UPI0012ED4E84|nr:hypothetical protein [Polaromonas jejuensis]
MDQVQELEALPLVVPSVPIEGTDSIYPVRRIFCVGLNDLDHAKEMGRTVERSAPLYFTKSPFAIVPSGSTAARSAALWYCRSSSSPTGFGQEIWRAKNSGSSGRKPGRTLP